MNLKFLALTCLALASPSTAATLIHNWTFDTNTNDTVGTHHGTLQGNAALTTLGGGKFGEAVTLDGNTDYVTVSVAAGQSSLPATDFSLTAWIYRETDGAFMYVAGTDDTSATRGAYLRVDTPAADSKLFGNLILNGTAQRTFGAANSIKLNEWMHVAMTVSSTSGTEIFVNGVSVGTNATAQEHTVYNLFNIGARDNGGNGFDGLIDDVAIFSGVLTQTEMNNVITLGAASYAVPEPTAALLGSLGLLALLRRRRIS